MKIIYLKKVEEGIYKPERLAEIHDIKQVTGVKDAKEMLSKPKHFVLAARMVDGTYHKVHSEISDMIKKKKDLILKGSGVASIAAEVYGSSVNPIQRFLIFDPKKNDEAYLLGEATEAIQKLVDFS